MDENHDNGVNRNQHNMSTKHINKGCSLDEAKLPCSHSMFSEPGFERYLQIYVNALQEYEACVQGF